MEEIKKLQPRAFTKFCMSIGAVPSSYIAGMTIEEQLLWFCSYLEKNVIPAVNNNAEAVEELQGLYTELKSYVDHYFDNLDVQEEINNKLDAMVEDGTLAEIINQEIFGDITERLEEVESLVVNTPEILFGITFKADGTGQPTEMDYMVSLDGINFSTIKIPDFPMRDPSITYDSNRKKFYLSGTPATQTEYTFIIYESSDLITWTSHTVAIPNYLTNIKMAPDLYYDASSDKLIVSFSYQYGTETDIDGETIGAYDIIFAETTDFTNFTMSNVRVANLVNAPNRNHIDSNIIFIDDVWYLAVKDDHSKVIEIYQSTNLTDFSLLSENILNANDENDRTIYLEGPCQYVFNNEYHIIADSYKDLSSIVNCKSSDYINFDFATTNLHKFRHGDIIKIVDNDVKKVIANLPNFTLSTSNKLTPMEESQPAVYIPRNFSGELTAIPNAIFFIEGNSTITNIRNPFNCNEQKFAFITNINENVTIQKIENVSVNRTIYNSSYNNEKIFTISLNKNSNVFGIDTFENITIYDYATMLSKISDVDANFEVTDAIGYKSGNVMQVMLTLKLLNNVSAWVSPILNFTDNAIKPVMKSYFTSDIMKNIAMFNSGGLVGLIEGSANQYITLNATYIVQ